MTRQDQIFFLLSDEAAFSVALLAARPSIRFVDSNVWTSPQPPLVKSISDCQSPFAFVWDSDLFPVLPSRRRADGRFDGPMAGVVIQFIRSRQEGSVLLSGSTAAGFDNPTDDIREFVKVYFGILRRISTAGFSALSKRPIPMFRVGAAAREWARSGNELRDRGTKQLFEVAA